MTHLFIVLEVRQVKANGLKLASNGIDIKYSCGQMFGSTHHEQFVLFLMVYLKCYFPRVE